MPFAACWRMATSGSSFAPDAGRVPASEKSLLFSRRGWLRPIRHKAAQPISTHEARRALMFGRKVEQRLPPLASKLLASQRARLQKGEFPQRLYEVKRS